MTTRLTNFPVTVYKRKTGRDVTHSSHAAVHDRKALTPTQQQGTLSMSTVIMAPGDVFIIILILSQVSYCIHVTKLFLMKFTQIQTI